jgi:hypothetical protein
VIPQPPGGNNSLVVDPYVGMGNLNPYKAADDLLKSGDSKADVETFRDGGVDVAAGDQ